MQTQIFQVFIAAADAIGTFVNIPEKLKRVGRIWTVVTQPRLLQFVALILPFLRRFCMLSRQKRDEWNYVTLHKLLYLYLDLKVTIIDNAKPGALSNETKIMRNHLVVDHWPEVGLWPEVSGPRVLPQVWTIVQFRQSLVSMFHMFG